MLTTIFPDGSVTREFSQNADSAFLAGDTAKSNPFWFALDSGWQVRCYPANTDTFYNWPMSVSDIDDWDSASVRVTVTRHWDQVVSLNKYSFFSKSPWKTISPKVAFEKKFRWFFTYYYFSEHYPKIEHFSAIPLSQYVSEEEAQMYMSGGLTRFAGMNGMEIMDKMKSVDQKIEQWLNHNLFEQMYTAVSAHLGKLEDFTIDSARFLQYRDSVYFMSDRDKLLEDGELGALLDRFYKTNAFSRLFATVEGFDKKPMNDNYPDFLNYYYPKLEYRLVMPGKVTVTNCERVPADTLHWTVTAYRFTLSDLELRAQSRKANWWAFAISGLIVVLAAVTWRKNAIVPFT